MSARATTPAQVKTLQISIEGQQVQVKVRRNAKARNLILRPDLRTNSIKLTLPAHSNLAHGLSFLEREHARILGWLNAQAPQKVHDGSIIPWQGMPYLVRHDARARRDVRIVEDALIVGGPVEQLATRLQRWMKSQALMIFKAKALPLAEHYGLPLTSIALSSAHTRWGSCSQHGRIRLNWRLILAPAWVCQSVIIHELAHLKHMNHSADFWALVHTMGGDRVQARVWLHTHGKELYISG